MKWRGIWLNILAALLTACTAAMAVPNITGFTTRADGNTITASIWNGELGGVYTYINGTLVAALNTLTTKGGILSYDGASLIQLGNAGAADNTKVLTLDNTTASGLKWAAPAGVGLTTTGDTLYYNGGNQRLAIGTAGQVLTVAGGVPTWATNTSNIPAGVIVLWSGSIASVPSGWHLCDGTSGTPNLQGLFIVGAGNVSPAASGGLGLKNPGDTGGSQTHQHVNNQGAGSATPGTGAGTVTDTQNHVPPYYALAYIQKL